MVAALPLQPAEATAAVPVSIVAGKMHVHDAARSMKIDAVELPLPPRPASARAGLYSSSDYPASCGQSVRATSTTV